MKTYTVKQVADMAGVTVRTLHFYDEIGLLNPGAVRPNGYREYGEKELIRLQQIMFFRELDFELDEIRKILDAPDFDVRQALRDQRKLIELRRKRLGGLLKTIDRTIISLANKTSKKKKMEDDKLYNSFSTDEVDQYAEEVKRRWGHTEAYKQSTARVAKMSKGDLAAIKRETEELNQALAKAMDQGTESSEVQALIAKHYAGIRRFYDCPMAMYRNLGKMYVDDPRFTATYDKYRPGLVVFMRDAIAHFCDTQEKK
ncbi:MAG TPA: MerR family transcriptional regulator [Candidatus Paceibacterota bacterium]|nr:MerR family transcriptional regulator [Candidatus Paceibacterota bacterium]